MKKNYITPPSRRALESEVEQTRREYAKRARKLLQNGKSLRQTGDIIGVSYETIRAWMKKYYPSDKEAEGEVYPFDELQV